MAFVLYHKTWGGVQTNEPLTVRVKDHFYIANYRQKVPLRSIKGTFCAYKRHFESETTTVNDNDSVHRRSHCCSLYPTKIYYKALSKALQKTVYRTNLFLGGFVIINLIIFGNIMQNFLSQKPHYLLDCLKWAIPRCKIPYRTDLWTVRNTYFLTMLWQYNLLNAQGFYRKRKIKTGLINAVKAGTSNDLIVHIFGTPATPLLHAIV